MHTTPVLILAVTCACLVALVLGLLVLIIARHKGATWAMAIVWGAGTAAFLSTFFLSAGHSMGLLPG